MTLNISYIINLLNEKKVFTLDRNQYLIDSFPTLKIDSQLSYDSLLSAILIAYSKIDYSINDQLKISIDEEVLKKKKIIIKDYIFNSNVDINKRKKFINNLNLINDNIILTTFFFNINLIIYNTESQNIKCFYYDQILDTELPFIIIKESKSDNSNQYYELVYSQNKYLFEYKHPLVDEIIPKAIIIGLENNKKLEISNNQMLDDFTEVHKELNQTKVKLLSVKLNNKIDRLINELLY